MKTKMRAKAGMVKVGVVPNTARRGVNAKSGKEIEHFLKEAEKFGAVADKKYVEIKKKVREAAGDLECKSGEIWEQAAEKIVEWLE